MMMVMKTLALAVLWMKNYTETTFVASFTFTFICDSLQQTGLSLSLNSQNYKSMMITMMTMMKMIDDDLG